MQLPFNPSDYPAFVSLQESDPELYEEIGLVEIAANTRDQLVTAGIEPCLYEMSDQPFIVFEY